MKKIVTLVLVFAMLFTMATCFTACGEQSDWEKVKEQGFFRCGITYYAPMNYFDENDTLVGFDTEFAEAVAKYLGVEVKFQVISWPNKYLELNNGSIDLIWNGFTYGNESDGVSRTEYVDFTHSYLENKQVVVTLTSRLNELNSADALKGKTAAVEGGSSGESVAVDFAGSEDKVAKFAAQSNALLEVKSGTAVFFQFQNEFAFIVLQWNTGRIFIRNKPVNFFSCRIKRQKFPRRGAVDPPVFRAEVGNYQQGTAVVT